MPVSVALNTLLRTPRPHVRLDESVRRVDLLAPSDGPVSTGPLVEAKIISAADDP